MAQIQIPSIIQRLLNFSLILVFLSAFIVMVIGGSTSDMRTEVKSLNSFLEKTDTLQDNFERSLAMYTDEPKKIIDFVLELRPDTEMEYIEFIGKVEDIASELELDLDLESINDSENTGENVLGYHVKFYGDKSDLSSFLDELEHMPHYIRVGSIDYKSLDLVEEDTPPNINLKIYLYVRTSE